MIPEKHGWRVRGWAHATGVSHAYVRLLIRRKKITSVKSGSARIITTSPAQYLADLTNEAALAMPSTYNGPEAPAGATRAEESIVERQCAPHNTPPSTQPASGSKEEWRARFWVTVPIAPIPKLAALHDLVLARSEKRSPKWQFRIAADLVIELQPKISKARYRFEGHALQVANATVADLISPRSKIGRTYWSMAFAITGDDQSWSFRPGYLGWKESTPEICDRPVLSITCFRPDHDAQDRRPADPGREARRSRPT